MHPNTHNLMRSFVQKYVLAGQNVVEIGSYNENGTYKDLLQHCTYLGVDVRPGPNVDIVSADHYRYPFPDDHFDVVISGQAMEHSKHPWKMVLDMARILKPGGSICLIAPWSWEIHKYPIDCFRILPDGMESMMIDAGLTVLECDVSDRDCYGIGKK